MFLVRLEVICTTKLRPLGRSTVSRSASAMVCRRVAAYGVAAPGSQVIQASRMRRVRSRCCWSHFDDNLFAPLIHSGASGFRTMGRTV